MLENTNKLDVERKWKEKEECTNIIFDKESMDESYAKKIKKLKEELKKKHMYEFKEHMRSSFSAKNLQVTHVTVDLLTFSYNCLFCKMKSICW